MKKARWAVLPAIYMAAICSPGAFGQSVCSDLDTEQYNLNRIWAELKGDYPITISTLGSCWRRARTDNDRSGCMGTAIGMAAICMQDKCATGSVDFTTRMAALAQRQANLQNRRQRYPSCVSNVENELDDFD